MPFKQQILNAVIADPISLRQLLGSPEVTDALGSIGVLPKILELHAPSKNSRKHDGLGDTLCGIRGTRHIAITCERCKKSKQ